MSLSEYIHQGLIEILDEEGIKIEEHKIKAISDSLCDHIDVFDEASGNLQASMDRYAEIEAEKEDEIKKLKEELTEKDREYAEETKKVAYWTNKIISDFEKKIRTLTDELYNN
jgi:protein-tyrosine-phosphatase